MILNYYQKMIDKFYEWFEGTFENKIQAFSFPGRFAMVRVIHKRIGDFFYGEQAYNYQLHAPYRTFVVKPVVEGDFVRIQNYSFQKNLYKGFHNLDSLEGDLTHKPECDSIVKFDGKEFRGQNTGCECHVPWKDKTTYLQTDVTLGENYYYVVDRGFLLGTTEQVWGSKHGRFEFHKLPS